MLMMVANGRGGVRKHPNVLLMTIDTLRWDHVGAYGSAAGATPAIDRLAAKGTRFDTAIAHVPLTAPAHASILTGLTPLRLQSLAGGLRHCAELRDLNLRFNRLGPAGAQALGPVLQGLRGLQRLDLAANELGHAGIRALIPTLQAAQDLQVLRMYGNGIYEDALRLALPRLRFHD